MSKVKQSHLRTIAEHIAGDRLDVAADMCRSLPYNWIGSWGYHGAQLANWLTDIEASPPFTVFSRGNGKLPFQSWSVLPFVTCGIGMGDCERVCYSVKAWRFPAAYFRQAQNTVLMKHQSDWIAATWLQLPEDDTVRLYVDGDFSSMADWEYWVGLLACRPDLQCYGYSKAWPLFTSYKGEWPTNYLLNLSSGSKHSISDKLLSVPIVRGEFLYVDIPKRLQGRYSDPEYKLAVRQSAAAQGIKRPFLCPGLCGSCTTKGHACGMAKFSGIPIAIGAH